MTMLVNNKAHTVIEVRQYRLTATRGSASTPRESALCNEDGKMSKSAVLVDGVRPQIAVVAPCLTTRRGRPSITSQTSDTRIVRLRNGSSLTLISSVVTSTL